MSFFARSTVATLATLILSLGPALPWAWAQSSEPVSHLWKRQYYGYLDGQLRMLFGPGFERGKPALGDLRHTGTLDLLMGTADGRIMYFENVGTAKNPEWRLANEAISAQTPDGKGAKEIIDVGANAAPALVDIDGDGDLDLFVGSASGKIYFYRNVGNAYLPEFRLENTDFLGKGFGLNAVPRFVDIDADGVMDLSIGTEDGDVYIIHNRGTRQNAKFCVEDPPPLDCLSPPVKLVHIAPEDNAVPEWVDWDGDGNLDLMVGKSDGRIAYYRNIGTAREGVWELVEPRFDILDAGGFAAPLFRDLNGDGIPDLLLTGAGQRIALYTTRQENKQRVLWLEQENVLRVASLGRYQTRLRVASGDLHGTGRPDLIIGTRGGALLYYENVGGKDLPAFKSREPILPTPQRAFASPTLADIDGDGLLDLIVGGRNGRLELIRNRGSRTEPRWEVANLFLSGVDVGAMSAPIFRDLDGDGDLDLIVGNSLGHLVLYENRGSKTQMDLVLRTTGLGRIRVPGSAVPDFFDWKKDEPPDLIIGSQTGRLFPAARNPGVPAMQGNAYQGVARAWGGISAAGQSLPHFVDLSGDGRPDLLLGGADGALRYWEYEGNVPTGQIAMRAETRHDNVVESGAPAPGEPGAALGAAPGVAGSAVAFQRPSYLDPVFVQEPTNLNELHHERNTVPAFFDVNGDGLPDLVVGTASGTLMVFINRGAKANPQWERAREPLVKDVGERNLAPAFADVNGDGLLDLLVGTASGRVLLWLNQGTARSPKFVRQPGALRSVRSEKNAVPMALDLNGDGRLDLLVGNLKGWIYHYIRSAGPALDFQLEQRRFIGLNVGVNASPTQGALTMNGEPVLLVGSDQGAITVLQRTTTSALRSSGWKTNRAFLEGLTMPPGSHPALGDVDGDGDLDLIVGSDSGKLLFFRNNAIASDLAQGGATSQ